MTIPPPILRPKLARHARYRWDTVRQQHQIVFPEGLLVLNDAGAAIVKLCDGRTRQELLAELTSQVVEGDPTADVQSFLSRLFEKGLIVDAEATT